jgi:hypothetical protein
MSTKAGAFNSGLDIHLNFFVGIRGSKIYVSDLKQESIFSSSNEA